MFGGQAVHNVSLFTDGETYLSMSNITLFDPSTQFWHYQPSSGDIPSQRDRFCVVGASGGDNTTFGESAYAIASSPSCLTNIFLVEISMYSGQAGAGMYGGQPISLANNAERDEVYVLSLPAFVWSKAKYTTVDPRMKHTCHVIGN